MKKLRLIVSFVLIVSLVMPIKIIPSCKERAHCVGNALFFLCSFFEVMQDQLCGDLQSHRDAFDFYIFFPGVCAAA